MYNRHALRESRHVLLRHTLQVSSAKLLHMNLDVQTCRDCRHRPQFMLRHRGASPRQIRLQDVLGTTRRQPWSLRGGLPAAPPGEARAVPRRFAAQVLAAAHHPARVPAGVHKEVDRGLQVPVQGHAPGKPLQRHTGRVKGVGICTPDYPGQPPSLQKHLLMQRVHSML